MKSFLAIAGGAALAAALVIIPVDVKISESVSTELASSSYTVTVEPATAEARKRSGGGSRARPARRSAPRKAFKRKSSSGGAATKRSLRRTGTKQTAKVYKPGKSPFAKSAATRQKAGNAPFRAPAAGAARTSTRTTRTPTATTGSSNRKPLSTAARGKRSRLQTGSLNSSSARTNRLSSQRTRTSRLRSTSRSDMRNMRSNRGYWRSERMYRTNVYWCGRNMYGWGYGYYPGVTYHRGWGRFGYGYTRGGLNIVDAMIIAAVFNQTQTSRGTTVINNYTTTEGYDPAEVLSVPKGTTIIGIAPNQMLHIPDGQGGFDDSPIPVGSTIQTASNGTLIQTPDGQAVLIPSGANAYKAETGYQVPASAEQAQDYGEYGASVGGSSNMWLYLAFAFGILGLGGVAIAISRKKA